MAPSSNRYKSNQPPPLPQEGFNNQLVNYKGKIRSVRTQDISLGPNSTITIARIKIPAPDKISAHLIKRFDTDAISATSFFNSAFPHSSEEVESVQMNYIQKIYDTRKAGALDLGPDHKLTGVWVPIEFASELAEAYGLTQFAEPLIAYPNPNSTKLDTTESSSPNKKAVTSELNNTNNNNPKTPKSATNHHHQSGQNKSSTDQVSTSTRSSKRTRVGPPCFGNTSPSTFNLSSTNKPSIATTTTTSTTQSNKNSEPIISVAKNAQNTGESDPQTPTQLAQNLSVDGAGISSIKSTKQLIGTDEDVAKAKQDALELVSNLRSSSIISSPSSPSSLHIESKSKSNATFNHESPHHQDKTTTGQDDDNGGGSKSKRKHKLDGIVNKKRSVDQALDQGTSYLNLRDQGEEEDDDDDADQQQQQQGGHSTDKNNNVYSSSSSFLPKLLWRRSGESNQRREEVVKKKKQKVESNPSRSSIIPLKTTTTATNAINQQPERLGLHNDSQAHQHLSSLDPNLSILNNENINNNNKRNLAIAGIFIAGAAASIVPYFF